VSGAGIFYSHHRVQTDPGVHQASHSTVTFDFIPESKAAGAWSWPITSI